MMEIMKDPWVDTRPIIYGHGRALLWLGDKCSRSLYVDK